MMSRTSALVMLKYAVVLICMNSPVVLAGADPAMLGTIISQLNESRTVLQAYSVNYQQKEVRAPQDGLGHAQRSALTNVTEGTYIIDRSQNRYKDVRERAHSWNTSRNAWDISKGHNAQYEGREVMLFEKWREGNLDSWPVGSYRALRQDEPQRKAGVMGPEQYFSRYGGHYFDEYLHQFRDSVSDLVKLDEYRCKIVMKSKNEAFAGYYEEYVVDSRLGGNVISEKGYEPDGRLRLEKTMAYETINGIPFLVHAAEKEYLDKEHPARVTREVEITVHADTAKLNPTVEMNDFVVEFPAGTYVQDEVRKVRYVVPDRVAGSRFTVEEEPVLAMLSGKEDSAGESSMRGETATQAASDDGQVLHHTDSKASDGSDPGEGLMRYTVVVIMLVVLLIGACVAVKRRRARGT